MARSLINRTYILYLKMDKVDDEKICEMAGLEWAKTLYAMCVKEYPDKTFSLEEQTTTIECNIVPL